MEASADLAHCMPECYHAFWEARLSAGSLDCKDDDLDGGDCGSSIDASGPSPRSVLITSVRTDGTHVCRAEGCVTMNEYLFPAAIPI